MTNAEKTIVEDGHHGAVITFDRNRPEGCVVRASFLREYLRSQTEFPRLERLKDALAQREIENNSRAPREGSGQSLRLWSLSIRGACVVGDLELSYIGAAGSPLAHLHFVDCIFGGDINLHSSVLGSFQVEQSYVHGSICADGAHFSDKVYIRACTFAGRSQIAFDRCRIDNSCDLSGLCVEQKAETASALHTCLQKLRDSLWEGQHEKQEWTAPEGICFDRAIVELMSGQKRNGSLSQVSFNDATILGDLLLEGVNVAADETAAKLANLGREEQEPARAIDIRGANIGGSLRIRRVRDRAMQVEGELGLYCARIGGDFELLGVKLTHKHTESALDLGGAEVGGFVLFDKLFDAPVEITGRMCAVSLRVRTQFLLHWVKIKAATTGLDAGDPISVWGDAAEIQSDFWFRGCVIEGTIRLPGASIGGQLVVKGTSIKASGKSTRSIYARDMKVRGGIFLLNDQATATEIAGEIHLDGAIVDGDFFVFGTTLRKAVSGNYAIQADSIRIKGDLLFAQYNPDGPPENSECRKCIVIGTVRIPGSQITGRIRLIGVKMMGHFLGAAFIASGSRVDGGVFCEPQKKSPNEEQAPCLFAGTFRINHAVIGSHFNMEGATIVAREVAVSAVRTTVQGSIKFTHCKVCGELRLYGCRISGSLEVFGGLVETRGTGFCIDAYNAEIEQGVSLTPPPSVPDDKLQPIDTLTLVGVVGLAYSKLGTVELGRFRSSDNKTSALIIGGSLRFTGAQVTYVTSIRRVVITPPCRLDDWKKNEIMRALGQWRMNDERTILDADHADLGALLDISFDERSTGYARFFGAKVKELYDENGKGWGSAPTGTGWAGDSCLPDQPLAGIRLGLNGFSYSHIGRNNDEECPRDSLWSRIIGKHKMAAARLRWLARQCPNKRWTADTFFPQPYLQLAEVLRDTGYPEEAAEITVERRKLHNKHAAHNPVDRTLGWIFGFFFGFGYSSWRASFWLLVLFLASWGFTWIENTGVNFTRFPDEFGQLRERLDATKPIEDTAPPCGHPIVYALSQIIPVVHLESGNGCDLVKTAGWLPEALHVLIMLLAWIVIPIAALTYSGILRESESKESNKLDIGSE
jgi:hypothetical protein